jgi:hypothetical protein
MKTAQAETMMLQLLALPWEALLAIVGLISMIVGWVSACAVFVYSTKLTRRDVGRLAVRMDEFEERLTEHASDYGRHIDPVRDENRWKDLCHRLDRIERKVERV